MDELVSGLKGWNPSSDEGTEPKAARGATAGPAGGAKSGGRASVGRRRYLTTADLLPEGLSDRFFRFDTSGDGQIEMSEFATTWTEEKAREFGQQAAHFRDRAVRAEDAIRNHGREDP